MAKVSYANMKLKMNESVKEVQLGETKIEVKQYLPVEEKYSFLNIIFPTFYFKFLHISNTYLLKISM